MPTSGERSSDAEEANDDGDDDDDIGILGGDIISHPAQGEDLSDRFIAAMLAALPSEAELGLGSRTVRISAPASRSTLAPPSTSTSTTTSTTLPSPRSHIPVAALGPRRSARHRNPIERFSETVFPTHNARNRVETVENDQQLEASTPLDDPSTFVNSDIYANMEMSCSRFRAANRAFTMRYCDVCCERRLVTSVSNADVENVCRRCRTERGLIKKYSAANDMIPLPLGMNPALNVIKDLTPLEAILCARAFSVMKIYRRTTKNIAFKGHCLNVPLKFASFVQRIPQRSAPFFILLHAGDERDTAAHVRIAKVRADYVRIFSQYLIRHSCYYQDVMLDEAAIADLPSNGVPSYVYQTVRQDDPRNPNLSGASHDSSDSDDIASSPSSDGADEDGAELEVGADDDSFLHSHLSASHQTDQTESSAIHAFAFPHTDAAQPLNEYSTPGLASMLFPELFTTGAGDPFANFRNSQISLQKAVDHLIHFSFYADGRWHTPFAAHKRFPAVMLDIIERRRLNSQTSYAISQNGMDSLTVGDVLDARDTDNGDAIVQTIYRYTANLAGSDPFWYQRKRELMSLLNSQSYATIFFTHSYPDLHDPELMRLLDIDPASTADYRHRKRVIANAPHIVDAYFCRKIEAFVAHFYRTALRADWIWSRFEFQMRSSVHLHGMARLLSDPGLVELGARAYAGHRAARTLGAHPSNNSTNISGAAVSPTELERLQSTVSLGLEASRQLVEYHDGLINAWNPGITDDDQQIRQPPQRHPSSQQVPAAPDHNQQQQHYVDALFAFQRHQCYASYCLRANKCRFRFPKALEPTSRVLFKDTPAGPIISIAAKRNDPLLSAHNPEQLKLWAGNCDMQLILDHVSAARYLVKYVSKPEKRSKSAREILNTVCEHYSANQNNDAASSDVVDLPAASLLRSLGIASAGERDRSMVEVVHLLASESMYHSDFSFYSVNLERFDRRLRRRDDSSSASDEHNATAIQVCPNVFDKYRTFCGSSEHAPMSLDRWLREIHFTGSRVHVMYSPQVPKLPLTPRYCHLFMAKHVPGYFADSQLTDAQVLSQYQALDWGVYSAFESLDDTNNNNANNEESLMDVVNAEIAARFETSESTTSTVLNSQEAQPDSQNIDDYDLIGVGEALPPAVEENMFNRLPASIPFNWTIGPQLDTPELWLDQQREFFSIFSAAAEQETTTTTQPLAAAPPLNTLQQLAHDIVINALCSSLTTTTSSLSTSHRADALRLLVHGAPGTGKSFLIKSLPSDHSVRMTPTGTTAFAISGATYHSSLRIIPNRPFVPLPGSALQSLQESFASITLIVIDEYAMIGDKAWTHIDQRLRQIKACDLPFGNINIVIFGDIAQLPPIGDKIYYRNPSSLLMTFDVIYLEEQMRQISPAQLPFRTALANIAQGTVTQSDWELFRDRQPHSHPYPAAEWNNAVHLYFSRAEALAFNLQKVARLQTPYRRIVASHSNPTAARSLSDDKFSGLCRELVLCIGARVMLTQNLWVTAGIHNGAFATVLHIVYAESDPPSTSLPLYVLVKFDKLPPGLNLVAGDCFPILPVTVQIVVGSSTCSRTQIPLMLAWAVTHHKAQGATFDRAVVDLGPSERASGQTLVALSRVRELEHMQVVGMPFARLDNLNRSASIKSKNKERKRLQARHRATLRKYNHLLQPRQPLQQPPQRQRLR